MATEGHSSSTFLIVSIALLAVSLADLQGNDAFSSVAGFHA